MYISPFILRHMKRIQALLDQLQPDAEAQAFVVPGSPIPRETVIVFTGSFNPPTVAHIAMLRQAHQYMRGQSQPMYLYAAFTKRTVDKEAVERPLLLDRIVLLQQLLQRRLPDVGILLFNRGLYVEQARAIRCSFPKVKRILFLMGFDKIVQILDPHYYEDRDRSLDELFHSAELLVAPRGGCGPEDLKALLQQPQNQSFARYIHALPFQSMYRDVSSTHIRQDDRRYSHDVPREVQQFMRETRAYAPPLRIASDGSRDCYEDRVRQLSELLGHIS